MEAASIARPSGLETPCVGAFAKSLGFVRGERCTVGVDSRPVTPLTNVSPSPGRPAGAASAHQTVWKRSSW